MICFLQGRGLAFIKYSSSSEKYRMDLDLEFANGKLTGTGTDNVGPFLISGHYEAGTQKCYWTKSYLGAHDVFYRGFREGKGIWGTWEIGVFGRGGFRIGRCAPAGASNRGRRRKRSSQPKQLGTTIHLSARCSTQSQKNAGTCTPGVCRTLTLDAQC